MNGQIGT